jgi:hypothetical protein
MMIKGAPDRVQRAIERGRWVTPTLILVVLLFFCSSLELGRVSAWIPQLVLSKTLVVLLLHLVKEYLQDGSSENTEEAYQPSMFAALSSIATMFLSVWLLGVIFGTMFFCLLYFRWHCGERWTQTIAFTVAMGLGVKLMFGSLMQVTLYPGVLMQAFS